MKYTKKYRAVKELDNDISKKRMELLHNITNTELDFEREQKKIDELVLKKRSLLKKKRILRNLPQPHI